MDDIGSLKTTTFDKNNTIVKETFMIGPLGRMKQFNCSIPFAKYPICHALRDEMAEWCKENCGGDYYVGLYKFWFIDVHDAMAFKLRWL